MKSDLTAVKLRSLLVFGLIVTFGAAIAGFYYGFGWIKSYADTVNQTVVAAQAVSVSSGSSSQIQQKLSEQQSLIDSVNSLFALSTNYQTQAIKDIYLYASKAGINVSDIKLDTPPAAAATTPTTTPQTSTAATKPVSVSLSSPVSYSSLLRFLTYIETNIPKMQVSGVEMSRPTDGSVDSVLITAVTINIYVR